MSEEIKRTKQVIVMRKDLKMRRGKEIAQGSHASMAFLTRQLQDHLPELEDIELAESNNFRFKYQKGVLISIPAALWIKSSFAKVCVRVESEEELMEIKKKSEEAGLETHLIIDSGRTEFNGIPTPTCLAIGPDYSDKIDKITSHLKLY